MIGALQFLAGQGGKSFAIAKAKMLRDIDPLEASERAHPDIVKLREQKSIDEMAAIDRELRVIDRFLGDLEPRRTRAEKTAAASPIQFRFRLCAPAQPDTADRTGKDCDLRSRPGRVP